MKKSNIIQLPPDSFVIGQQEMASYYKLKEKFSEVTIFGGCLRDAFIRQNTRYSAPTNDIDIKVSTPRESIPYEIALILQNLPANTLVNLPPHQQRQLSDWLGLNIESVFNRPYSWSLSTFDNPQQGLKPVDISILKQEASNQDVTKAVFENATSVFSSIAFNEDGITCHRKFPDDAANMQFRIIRDMNPRNTLWRLPYFERMKAKYPDLELCNPEIPLLLLAQRIYNGLRGHNTRTQGIRFENPTPTNP